MKEAQGGAQVQLGGPATLGKEQHVVDSVGARTQKHVYV